MTNKKFVSWAWHLGGASHGSG